MRDIEKRMSKNKEVKEWIKKIQTSVYFEANARAMLNEGRCKKNVWRRSDWLKSLMHSAEPL